MKQTGQMVPIQEHEVVQDAGALVIVEPSRVYFVMKRCVDVCLALIGILMLLPVFLIIALCIKIDDRGPVLHLREIVGSHGKRFRALKFRTMITNADVYLQEHPELMDAYLQNMKLERDPRITHVG